MPIHDWTRVKPGIFHDFHHSWIEEIKRALNRGLLPPDHYALAEQITTGMGPDVLTLELTGPTNGATAPPAESRVALLTVPPQVWHRATAEIDRYAAKAKVVTIRHSSNHRVVAVIEIVSPGNKHSRQELRRFVEKAAEMLWAGVHLLIIDLFPRSPRDPQGIHKAIWDEIVDEPFALPEDRPLTVASYIGGPIPEALVEPVAVGAELPAMPLYLTTRGYVSVPLEVTYQSAWEAVPAFWRKALTA